MTEILHQDLSYRVVGCALRVHAALGPGFPEGVYAKAMRHELAKSGVPFETEQLALVSYDGVLCGEFRVDIVADERIVLELKALAAINDEHMAQAISYLKATGLTLAILVNFGAKSLETRRVVL